MNRLRGKKTLRQRVYQSLARRKREMSPEEIAVAMGLDPHQVADALRDLRDEGLVLSSRRSGRWVLWSINPDPPQRRQAENERGYSPSEEEIQAKAEEIRSGWGQDYLDAQEGRRPVFVRGSRTFGVRF